VNGKIIVNTSGTTGDPKRVVLSYAGLMALGDAELFPRGEVYGVDRQGITLFNQAFWVVQQGKTLVVKRPDDDLAQWVRREKINVLCTSGAAFRHMMKSNGEWPDLKRIDIGGEMITSFDFELYKARLSNDCIFSNRYAVAECGGPVTRMYFKKDSVVTEGRLPVGRPIRGVIVSIENRFSDVTKEGEILVRTPRMALGYYNDPELTAKKFKDGWYHTGDLGWFDDDGILHHEGRMA
jgi:acyl-coenzyme A synthetase/AMP-(fatty) acid ligase